MPDILVMTTNSARAGHAAAAIAALGEVVAWQARQPGFVRTDVLADPTKPDTFWIAERWLARSLRDAARLDPGGAARLAKVEALLDKDDVAAYVPVDLYPHHANNAVPDRWLRSADAGRLSPIAAPDAPMVQIARFHLKPGTYDRFLAPNVGTMIRSMAPACWRWRSRGTRTIPTGSATTNSGRRWTATKPMPTATSASAFFPTRPECWSNPSRRRR